MQWFNRQRRAIGYVIVGLVIVAMVGTMIASFPA